MTARAVAAAVLLRVWKDDAYAAPALSSEIERAGLAPRDRALSTELSYGVLRTQKYLEGRLSKFGRIKTSELPLLSHLLIAAYQIEFLDRVPARAAVNEAVQLIAKDHDRRIAGFANAILRRLSEDGLDKMTLSDATFASAPSWLKKRLVRQLGEQEARGVLAAEAQRGPFLRINGGRHNSELEAWLSENAEPVPGVPFAYRFTAGGDPRKSSFYEQGNFIVQELGAQMIAHCVGAREGESILDACAGRGQKTSFLCERVGATGRVIATDLHDSKVKALSDEMQRLGFEVEAHQWDFTQEPPAQLEAAFDRVLVDAPCTGVGTLGRRPEIARRLRPEDPARMGQLQLAILRNAARCLRPSGLLVFSTCSVFDEEGKDVVEALVADGLKIVPPEERPRLPPFLEEEAPFLRLSPSRSETDGYFIAWLEK